MKQLKQFKKIDELIHSRAVYRGTGIQPQRDGSHRVTYPADDGGARQRRLVRTGWIFFGIVAAIALLVILVLLVPEKSEPEPVEIKPAPAVAPQPASAGGISVENAPAQGSALTIGRVESDFTAPGELSFGVPQNMDLSALSESISANVRSAGWGNVNCTATADALLITAAEQPVFTAADYDAQKAFLASAQPENFARTFLQDSGIISLLSQYGFSMSSNAYNNKGEITFRGTGANAQDSCAITFSFLYTGAFNQARLTAVKSESSFTTKDIVPLKKAAARAISWTAARAETVTASSVSIEYVRGIPFYVFSLSDGGEAYALAITEAALSQSPEAVRVYSELMDNGISEYVETNGGE